MAKRTFTIGMAGHIDHGKTTLTKALTDIDTDRLKEEKERNVSIEPGFAPLRLTDDMDVSIIDVPGHERFIRQMIAGVAGIDAVVLTVAADEGVMPQTKEHLEILSLLGVTGGLIAVTKMDNVEEDLLELAGEDIRQEVQGTPFAQAEMVFVDSISKKGIDAVRTKLTEVLQGVPARNVRGAFRLPIDQVFSVHGQGTIVRGTVYEGSVEQGDTIQALPLRRTMKIRQLQVHGQQVQKGVAGQRLAMNVSGVDKEDLKRGDVVVSKEHYVTTKMVNIVLYTSNEMYHALKQRGHIKLHLGTAEVYGNIVFFDRNLLHPEKQEVLCQLRLDEPVVTKRKDKFIVRRPSPMETIGGGWVINPNAERLRFGDETIKQLATQMQGTPEDHIKTALWEKKWLDREALAKESGLLFDDVKDLLVQLKENDEVLEYPNGKLVLRELYDQFLENIIDELQTFHDSHILQIGKNKQELQSFKAEDMPKELSERLLEKAEMEFQIKRDRQFVSLYSFRPSLPQGWQTKLKQAKEKWIEDSITPRPWGDYMEEQGIPAEIAEEFKHSLLQTNEAVIMDNKHLWPASEW
ncbi:selenocysteine-specific translation elongation factor [Salibacterium salarium]|uniref:selenocysteine-specific translation elongation factor n=1 Tax=Salibacterium salarium TaxID=284579 RepID=UPI001FE6E9F8|nr:selenocysteine-specific translation elongation factor [Salibacterium salarium]